MEVRTEPVLTPPSWHKSVLLASPVRLHHPHKDRLESLIYVNRKVSCDPHQKSSK